MINVVLDTNVIISGLLTPHGNSSRILTALKNKRFNLFYSYEIITEYQDVLLRAKFGFPLADVADLIDVIQSIGYPVQPSVSTTPLPDESDRVFYDTARHSQAYLVTGNMKHYPSESWIITPAVLLTLIYEHLS